MPNPVALGRCRVLSTRSENVNQPLLVTMMSAQFCNGRISMSARLEVEAVIKQLPETEVRDLAKWLQTYLDEMWDQQIESDLNNGKLDSLIARAEADIAKNNVRELDEVLHHI
jgi:predicted nucleotidyltransferase